MSNLTQYTKYTFQGCAGYIISSGNSAHELVTVRHSACVAPWVDVDVHMHEISEEYYFLLQGELWFLVSESMVIVTHSDVSDHERAVQAHRCLSGLDVPKDVVVKTRAEFEFFRDVRASLEHKIHKQGKVPYERSQKATGAELAHEGAT